MWQVGAHTKGQNAQSIGYCIVGNFDKDMPPQSLYNFIAKHIVDVVFKYYNNQMSIHGHKEFKDKTCPGLNFDLSKLKKAVKTYEYTKNKTTKIISTDLNNIKSIEEIFKECLNSPEKMLESINYIEKIAKDTEDIGILESMKYIKLAFKKVYYRNKDI
jgi:N-acetyl-anhydromuramyl-L-alanine amidase AmpD